MLISETMEETEARDPAATNADASQLIGTSSSSTKHKHLDDAATLSDPVDGEELTAVSTSSTNGDFRVTERSTQHRAVGRLGDGRLPRPCSRLISTRCWIALLSSLGMCIATGIRSNMFAVITLIFGGVDSRQHIVTNGTDFEKAIVNWSPSDVGLLDSVFYWAFLIIQLPGGYLAYKFPANLTFGGAIAATAILNLLLPEVCKVHYVLATAVRALQGLVEGIAYPSIHGIWRHWAPPLERSRLATISLSGQFAGVVFGISISRFLSTRLQSEVCFYVFGACGLVWFGLWYLWTSETPSKHKTISSEERTFITNSISPSSDVSLGELTIRNCRNFSTSKSVNAIHLMMFCYGWTFYILIIAMQKYLWDVFYHRDLNNTLLNLLPTQILALTVPIGGCIADLLRQKTRLSTTAVRKIFTCGGFGVQTVLTLGVAFVYDTQYVIVLTAVATAFNGFSYAGIFVNHLDIAPQFASILQGASVFASSVAGVGCSMALPLLTQHKTVHEWKVVFVISSLINVVGIIFYYTFASGDIQPWAYRNQVNQNKPDEPKSLTKDEMILGDAEDMTFRQQPSTNS